MINIIKSVNYGLRRDSGVIISVILMLTVPFTIMLGIFALMAEGIQNITPSFLIGSQAFGMIFAFSYAGVVIISAKAMGGDNSDKTINYEIMSGHNRLSVFAGRMICGILWGTILVIILNCLPILVFYLINGWGSETEPYEVIIRLCLTFFPVLRLCALNMMFASLLGSAGKGIAAGFGFFVLFDILESILADAFNTEINYGFGFMNILVLLIPQNSREFIIDGKPVTVFDTSVPPEMIIKTIGISLAFTVVYLTVSYILFKKKDRQ